MLTMLLCLAAQDPATPTPPSTASGQSAHGVPVSVILEAVEDAAQGTLSFMWEESAQVERRTVRLGAHRIPEDPAARLAWLRGVLQIADLAVVEMASNTYAVVSLADSLPAVDLPRFTEVADLPNEAVLCDLEVRLNAIAGPSAQTLVLERLHPSMRRYAIFEGTTLLLRDFAPTLRNVAELLGRLDRAAAESRVGIRVEFALVNLMPGSDPQGSTQSLPASLREPVAGVAEDLGEGFVELIGMTSGRYDPNTDGTGGLIELGFPIETGDGTETFIALIQFNAMVEGVDIRLANLHITEGISYGSQQLILPAGDWRVLHTEGSGRAGFRILLARGSTEP